MRKFLKNDYWWAIFWLGILVLIFFLPVVVGKQMLWQIETTVFSSASGKFYHLPGLKTGWVWAGTNALYLEAPQTLAAMAMFHHGIFSLWDPLAGAGHPLLASLTNGLYFPLKFAVFYFLPYLGTFDFYFILRLFIAGFGMFLFLKTLALSRQAAILGAIAYMFSGHFIVNLVNWWLNVGIVLPFVLFSFELFFKTLQKKYIGLAAIFLALLILGSQPQTTLLDGFLIFLYFLFRLFSNADWKKLWRQYLLFIVLSSVLAFLIAAPMIADFSAAFLQGPNVHTHDPQILEHYSPSQMLYFVVSPTMFLEFALFGRILPASHPIIFQYYSVIVWILALLGFFAVKRDKLQYFFAGYGVFVLLRYAGIPPFYWISYLPPFNKIFWLEHDNTLFFALAVLAAFGYEKLREEKIDFKKYFAVVAGAPLLFIAAFLFDRKSFLNLYLPNFDLSVRRAGPLAAFESFLAKLPHFIQSGMTAFLSHPQYFVFFLFGVVLFFALAVLFMIWRYQKTRSKIIYGLILVLLVAEFFVYMPKIRDGGFRRWNPYPVHPAIQFLEEHIAGQSERFIGSKDVIPPYVASVFKLQDFRINDPLLPKRYLEFARQFLYLSDSAPYQNRPFGRPPVFISSTLGFDESDWTPALHRFLDMANIKYVVTEEPLLDKNLKQVFDEDDLMVYENETVLPRAYVVYAADVVPTIDQAASVLNRPDFDYHDTAVIDGNYPEIDLSALSKTPEQEAQIISYSPNDIRIKADFVQKGLLVLTDSFYPGWEAYVDGQKATIYPANILFRAVAVPAGEHEIRFVYRPWLVFAGFILSFATIAAIIIFCWLVPHFCDRKDAGLVPWRRAN